MYVFETQSEETLSCSENENHGSEISKQQLNANDGFCRFVSSVVATALVYSCSLAGPSFLAGYSWVGDNSVSLCIFLARSMLLLNIN